MGESTRYWHSGQVSAAYEQGAPFLAEAAQDLVALAQPPDAGRVLDIGSGTGLCAEAASRTPVTAVWWRHPLSVGRRMRVVGYSARVRSMAPRTTVPWPTRLSISIRPPIASRRSAIP